MQSESSQANLRVIALKQELFILMARRSLRPCMTENSRMWKVMAELYELTNDENFNLKSK
jgi:hypothetical protein